MTGYDKDDQQEIQEDWDETPRGTGRGGSLGTPGMGDPPDELRPARDPEAEERDEPERPVEATEGDVAEGEVPD